MIPKNYLPDINFLVCSFFEAETEYSVQDYSWMLLFLLYVNDLQQSSSDAGSYLYADDICIFYQHEDVAKN